jgi:hypothetical protein
MLDTAAMDQKAVSNDDGGDLLIDADGAGRAASYAARERQKQELRDERDRLVLNLAGDLGEPSLAERMGVNAAVIDKLLAGARNRLDAKAASALGSGITARRGTPAGERWVDADRHYATLGAAQRASELAPAPRFQR